MLTNSLYSWDDISVGSIVCGFIFSPNSKQDLDVNSPMHQASTRFSFSEFFISTNRRNVTPFSFFFFFGRPMAFVFWDPFGRPRLLSAGGILQTKHEQTLEGGHTLRVKIPCHIPPEISHNHLLYSVPTPMHTNRIPLMSTE